MRLDQYMAQYWPEYSRSSWQKFIERGLVSVNDQVCTSVRYELAEDDEVTHQTLPVASFESETLSIVYEDAHVVVVNKPSGVLTHAKGEIVEEFTVADFVRSKMTEVDDTNRPGIVHRLDRETSGVLIAARDGQTKHLLQKQFQDRKAHKMYLAVVRGIPKEPEAMIDLPIDRNPRKPSSFRVHAGGKSAQTYYKVIASRDGRSVIELRPITGRTHQLRVHLAYIGTPIIGDVLYGGGKSPIARLCLHAASLEITIPISDRRTFTADPPRDMQELIDAITR